MTDQPTRAEETAERRRKRTGIGVQGDPGLRRFGIDESYLDLDKYAYRSVEDTGNRLYMLTEQDDYDFVTMKGDKSDGARKADQAGVLRYQHGVVDGQAKYTYLLRKPNSLDQADRQERLAKVDEEEKTRKGSAQPDSNLEKTYKPKS